jgi:putative endonuclease
MYISGSSSRQKIQHGGQARHKDWRAGSPARAWRLRRQSRRFEMVVYILFSKTTNRHYTGHCEDLHIRIQQHNSGKSKSTQHGIPWEIVYVTKCSNRSEAMKLEKKIKFRGAKRYLLDIVIE